MTVQAPLRLSMLALCLAGSAAAQVYVSPKGNDAADGTKMHPVKTLAAATKLARNTANHSVLMADGVYRLDAPLVLSSGDAGATFEAMPLSNPIVSGGLQVTGWKKVDAARNLWQAPAPAGLENSRQMYVNGVRAPRAHGRVPVALTMTATGYTMADSSMSAWKNQADMEFVYTGGNSVWNEHSEGLGSWTEPRCPIASITGTAITMAQPCWNNSTLRVMLQSGERTANLVGPKSVGKQPTYIENALELLGTPGQWYFDRPAKTIYYVPRPAEDLLHADVEIPALETLLLVDTSAHDVTFKGIEFAYATWLGPSTGTGFSEIQANYQVTGDEGYSKQALCTLAPGGTCPYGAWTKTTGAVSVVAGHHVQFLNDAFVHLGSAGLDLGEGTQKSVVEGCIFNDTSGNGVQLGGVSQPLAPAASFTSDNTIDNNLFRHVGAEYRGGIAIVIGYAAHTLVAHNDIAQIPYAGISIGWGGWPDKIKMAGQANRSTGNVLMANSIHDFMLVLSDGGGIYTQGRTGHDLGDGERVIGNVIYNQYSSGHGIYTDNGSSMITMRDNVVFHTNHDNINSRHRDYYDGHKGENFNPLAIDDNWWQQGDVNSDKEHVQVHGNHIIGALSEAPASIVHAAGLEAKYKPLLLRRFGAASAPEPPMRTAAFGMDSSAYVTWSPSVDEGFDAVKSYTVTASDGQHTTITASEFRAKTYVKMAGLKNGQDYTFTVRATNTHGTSSASMPTHPVAVAPRALAKPKAPESVKADVDHGRISVHFGTPLSDAKKDEELPVTAYAVTVEPGHRKAVFTGRNVIALQEGKHVTFGVVDGLAPAASYKVTVAAVNDAGQGEPATVTAVPVAAPALPLPTDISKAIVDTTIHRIPLSTSLGKWGYQQALFLYSAYMVYQRTGDKAYLAYIRTWADAYVDKDGKINNNLNALDYMLPGKLMLVLYKETGDERYATAAKAIRKRLDTYPRTEDGALWHATTRQHQRWLDGTYMALPFVVRFGETFDDKTYAYNEATKNLLLYAKHLNDPKSGLLFHAYDETGAQPWADPVTHHSSTFWARSIGWYGMALVDILDTLPKDHPDRAKLIALVQQLAQAYTRYQDPATGLWFNVVNQPKLAGNWLETSASSMYVYMIEKAVQHGYVAAKYEPVACKGYRGVLSQLSADPNGDVHIANICDGTNVSDQTYYLNRPRYTDDLHGLGAFILMNEAMRETACGKAVAAKVK